MAGEEAEVRLPVLPIHRERVVTPDAPAGLGRERVAELALVEVVGDVGILLVDRRG
ncbi:hypothetical protein [Sorangium sp. So ce1078]|uniref:hypothetical protein n=1 Tax=Sorangium sp. So ce1078 TaxID=3133329 RepID=UPI003F61B1E3